MSNVLQMNYTIPKWNGIGSYGIYEIDFEFSEI